jgi:hypothetical protein
MNFLPTNYTTPKSSNSYMKLQDGDNKFRILSQPIIGWEDWDDKKPVRFRFNEKPLKPIDPKKPVKHFWAFIVWNYMEEKIQILQVTQATIRNCIESLCKDQDWGAPYFYDIKILKKGEGKDTAYMVNPLPHKPVDPAIKKAFYEKRCNLDALFEGLDPFAEWDTFTDGIFDQPGATGSISKTEAEALQKIIDECDAEYRKQVYETLKKTCNVDSIFKLPSSLYDKVKTAAEKKRAEFRSFMVA